MEMIVGDDNQLNPNNIRYVITIYLSDEIIRLQAYELYTQDEDGTRHEVKPTDVDVQTISYLGQDMTFRQFIIPEHTVGTEYYLGVTSPHNEYPLIK